MLVVSFTRTLMLCKNLIKQDTMRTWGTNKT